MTASRFVLGVDVGSTTVKAVLWDCEHALICWKDYRRHGANQRGRLREMLVGLEQEPGISPKNCRIFLTGSGASEIAPLVGGRYVQEVHAVALQVERSHQGVRSVVELGGQDAKIILFRQSPKTARTRKISHMNDKCAGGTGAVIDRITAKLGLDPEFVRTVRYQGRSLHPVAGKCGVFAETDITNLRNRGVPPEELVASLFDALVLQNLTVLARGNTLFPDVLLLGGPHFFFPGLVEAWRAHLPRLWRERGEEVPEDEIDRRIYAPPDAQYFGALGAVAYGLEEAAEEGWYRGWRSLDEAGNQLRSVTKCREGLPGPAASPQDLRAFLEAYRPPSWEPSEWPEGRLISGFLGIDGGSTSTKAVVISEHGKLLAKAYRLSRGNPLQDLIEVLKEIRGDFLRRQVELRLLGVGTTGYLKDLFRDLLQADVALVETVAHAKAALRFQRQVDVIVDVGGQDIKLVVLREGHVKDFMLNSQCSAGNGFYLQATSEGFGYPVEKYAEVAFRAEAMPNFGYGCAVFLQADIVNFQRQGWRPEEILAGLAYVLPKNVWLYVARIPHLPSLGTRFVLQGGTHRNLAAVKAQVDYIREQFRGSGVEPQITVHPHCGEAGAVGAALEAARLWRSGRESRFIGLDRAVEIRFNARCDEQTRCFYCTNRCVRTFLDVEVPGTEVRRLITASCEKGAAESVEDLRRVKARLDSVKAANPNLAETAAREVWKPQHPLRVADEPRRWSFRPWVRRRSELIRRRGNFRVGIPRVLNFYQYAPFFSAYLQSLGVRPENIVFSDYTSSRLYREGAQRGVIDPCYPAKVALAHVHNLLVVKHRRKRLDCIFFPLITKIPCWVADSSGEDACCTVAATPQTVRAAMTREVDVFEQEGVVYLAPLLDLADRALLAGEMFEAWEAMLGLTPEENDRAMEQAWAAQERFEGGLRRRGKEVLEMLEREGRIGILILGRPYHQDPGVHHGLFDRLQELGYPILTPGSLPLDPDVLERLFADDLREGVVGDPLEIGDVWVNAYSTNSSQKIWAAKFAARHPLLVAVDVSSFNCGHDAAIARVCEAVVEASGRPLFAFRDLDENRPTGTFQIRLETIDYFLKEFGQGREKGLRKPCLESQEKLLSSRAG
ncbi:MAG TPA: BadF/BadG/BcrA/BcrD ATPase family protein [Acidobacteriota bacterium]|jgi:activator of 2-hydroxyglutaryl-CoA dehydratase/predicted nucleotide-binding protein (sugar kinase/HSP70/actin superfamily)|nr:BadF/BadG/BcrA/BcrD ATPase family protein [Acidobacteriota bacterium]HRV08882.1 BadF/BadG/BcrA/BcrD ATPase family protein [Acidobacteriota bacterium]